MENKGNNGTKINGYQPNRTHKMYTGSLIPCQTLQVTTISLTGNATITLRNPGDTSIYMAWLAAAANDNPPGSAIDVYPGDTHVIELSQTGSFENKFLLIHNTSAVKEGVYEIEVVG